MKRISWKILIPVALGVLLLAFLLVRNAGSSGADASRRASAPLVRWERPVVGDVIYRLDFTGDIAAIQQAGIYAKVTGTLERVFADMGMDVRQGQVLALIDTTELAQQYQQATATYENARVNYRRTQELSEQQLVSRQDLDNASAALKIAEANHATARTRLGYATITAPFAGTVTKRFLDPGAVVSTNNATLFTLMDLNQLKVIINILEKDIPRVQRGSEAAITVDAFPGRTFSGKVVRFSEAVDQNTRTMAVEIDINNPGHQLKPGMFANVTLTVGTHRHALTVPTGALFKDDAGAFLYAVVRDSSVRLRVGTGLDDGSRTEILSGLDSTAAIITTGQQFVRDHAPVTVQH